MATQIIGIDHIYISVMDMETAEQYYDKVMAVLGFKKNEFDINGVNHIQYFNKHFGYVMNCQQGASSAVSQRIIQSMQRTTMLFSCLTQMELNWRSLTIGRNVDLGMTIGTRCKPR